MKYIIAALTLFALAGAAQAIPNGCIPNSIATANPNDFTQTCNVTEVPAGLGPVTVNSFYEVQTFWIPRFVILKELPADPDFANTYRGVGDLIQFINDQVNAPGDHFILYSDGDPGFMALVDQVLDSPNAGDLTIFRTGGPVDTFSQPFNQDPANCDPNAPTPGQANIGLCGLDTINLYRGVSTNAAPEPTTLLLLGVGLLGFGLARRKLF